MRVAIADDHMLLREGLARLLAEAQMDVVLQDPDAERLLAGLSPRARPDVAVIDIRLPPTFTDEGLRAADTIREAHPEIAVVILSQYLETAYALRLLERLPPAASATCSKIAFSQVAVLTDAIGRVAGRRMRDRPDDHRAPGRQARARAIARRADRARARRALAVAEGRSNRAIARQLFLSEKTVEGNVRRIFDKLALAEAPDDNRRVLAVLAYLRG